MTFTFHINHNSLSIMEVMLSSTMQLDAHIVANFPRRVIFKVKHINIQYNKFITSFSAHHEIFSLNIYTDIIQGINDIHPKSV